MAIFSVDMIAEHAIQLFVSGDVKKAPQEFTSQAELLKIVPDQHGELGFITAVRLAKPPDSQDFAIAGSYALPLGHQSHLAVIIDEADSRQALVGHALVQLQIRR